MRTSPKGDRGKRSIMLRTTALTALLTRITAQATALVIALILSTTAHAYDLLITEQQLQDTLNQQLPYRHNGQWMSLSITQAQLDLLGEGNRVALQNDFILVSQLGLQSRGNLHAEGTVRFDNDQKAFFIDEPIIKDVDIEGVPEQFKASVIQLAQQTLSPALSERPVYVLRDEGNEKLARMLLKTLEITENDVRLFFSPF
ncbi:MAG: hypothetical protein CMK92_00555 [Pseudomonas sp.]|nr:hypothetical protein [Pseudomonas sp.]